MGWASGSEIADATWNLVRDYIPEDKRKEIADKFVEVFEDHDCDTIDEAESLVSDADNVQKNSSHMENVLFSPPAEESSNEDDQCEKCKADS